MPQGFCFKPYYNWIAFNTNYVWCDKNYNDGFKPYYNWIAFNTVKPVNSLDSFTLSFKPYYNWIAFNTEIVNWAEENGIEVLNLIITG